ncbi:lysophospholipase [Cellulomonas chengniuliangii]|uniref:Lysophospholipase n=1 Tax=Cellulomonas chengniuliangii TaxID=2968084 RepID=A0ABY5KX43_9CELL|nr:alpha/beta fold hydrolase [Cellulomonas chengniuliangii]UUI75065.1 lysophospholipase [Cellulomonas chengniuliangii]
MATPTGARWKAPLLALPVVALVLVGAVWVGQQSFVYHPARVPVPPAAERLPGAQDVALRTSDGLDLGAWWLPPAEGCRAAVLLAHGNGGNRSDRAALAGALNEHGFGVLMFDYRGYGGNAGRPTEAGLALDVRAARAYLLDEMGIDEQDLVYLGESLGTAVVSELAVEHPPAALVLRSPLTSLDEVGHALYRVPVGWLLRDRYLVRENVGRLAVPTAVVYGTGDAIVPAAQSRDVARTAREAGVDVLEVEVPGAGHNDEVLAEGPALIDALMAVAVRGGVRGCR